MADLKDLRNKREEILKAELAAWLHDWQKCIDMTVASHWKRNKFVNRNKIQEWKKRGKECAPRKFSEILEKNTLFLCEKSEDFNVKNLIEIGREPSKAEKNIAFLVRTLGRAHRSGHIEKELEVNECLELATDWLSTPLGYDHLQPSGFLCRLVEKPVIKALSQFFFNPSSQTLNKFLKILEPIFKEAWGDTRCPINEVTLWDWSSIVAALYKAEIARCVLTCEQRKPKDIKWRLLSIRTNGLEYLLSAPSIPDIKVRQELLKDAWNKVLDLLEVEYPLVLEVYRDENGPVFVVPDIHNLLELTDSERNSQTLRELIMEQFRGGTVRNDQHLALKGEIVPAFYLDKNPWDGQSKLPPIEKHLEETPALQPDPQWVAEQWCNFPEPQERCSICGLRPQGQSPTSQRRKMCDVCEKRREGRAKQWAVNIGRSMATIWIDEVADKNGRIALLVSTFDLTHWLEGTLVRTLAVRTPNDQNGHTADKVAKNPSFARLRRIWETTRKFWQEVAPTNEKGDLAKSLIGQVINKKRSHVFLKGIVELKEKNRMLPYHAYELEIQHRKVAVLWVPDGDVDIPEKYHGGFWVVENLDYLDNVYGQSFSDLIRLLQKEQVGLSVYEPSEYGRPGHPVATFTISKESGVQYLEDNYIPLISILAEPQVFMAIIPADKAFEVVKAIKTKYEREMGKVRNRLPLHIGVVYAYRKMPLRAILDAGRRMLKQKWNYKQWEVVNQARKSVERGDKLPESLHEDKNGQFKELFEILLKQGNRTLTWYIPAIMGDGQTEDRWYPYVFLKSLSEPTDRNCYYKAKNPWNSNHSWLVHAGELKSGDKIYFTPATFDFEFLETNARRFEIAYDCKGRRKNLLTRPYFLDEIGILEKIWNFIAKIPKHLEDKVKKPRLSSTQIFSLREIIETKREEWFSEAEDSLKDESFKKFCHNLFVNAQWQWKWSQDDPGCNTEDKFKAKLKWLTDMAVYGYFADAVYLFHHIMKEKSGGRE